MNTANLSKWVDELQGQIDQLKLKVAKAGESGDTITPSLTAGDQIATINTNTALYAKKAVAPFLDFENGSEWTTVSEVTTVTATADCAFLVSDALGVALVSDATADPETIVYIPNTLFYVKSGQIVSINPTTSQGHETKYMIFPLLEATQPVAATRSKKK